MFWTVLGTASTTILLVLLVQHYLHLRDKNARAEQFIHSLGASEENENTLTAAVAKVEAKKGPVGFKCPP